VTPYYKNIMEKFLNFLFSGLSMGIAFLVVALLLGFTPIQNEAFSDPCGSVFLPDRTYFSENGAIVHKLTPPCRDVFFERLKPTIAVGSIGVVITVASVYVTLKRRHR
tara:strand:- start:359 stop:682 length:324 start_codon:yes stop_codon:yes gene_type:complete